jgi:hypothetical protein
MTSTDKHPLACVHYLQDTAQSKAMMKWSKKATFNAFVSCGNLVYFSLLLLEA